MPCKFHAPCTTSIKPIAYIITLLCVNIFFLQHSNPSIFSSLVILFIIAFFFVCYWQDLFDVQFKILVFVLIGFKTGEHKYCIFTELCSI